MDEALAFDAEAAERALDESTANSHARLMQLIRGVIRATAGTDGEEDEGLEGRAAAERDDDTDEVARESTASERAAAAAWLREDDDAARVADEALLEELFFAETGAFDVNDDEDEGEEGDAASAAPSPETTAAVARASACSLVDAQLSTPNTTPDVEIRLTAHVGLVRALDPLSLVPAEDAEPLVAIFEGGASVPGGRAREGDARGTRSERRRRRANRTHARGDRRGGGRSQTPGAGGGALVAGRRRRRRGRRTRGCLRNSSGISHPPTRRGCEASRRCRWWSSRTICDARAVGRKRIGGGDWRRRRRTTRRGREYPLNRVFEARIPSRAARGVRGRRGQGRGWIAAWVRCGGRR